MFDKVIELLIEFDCLGTNTVYIDLTDMKMYTNKKKNYKEIIEF